MANVNSKNIIGGNVKITFYDGTRKIKELVKNNTGTIDFCSYLRSAIIGSYVIAKRPGVLRAGYTRNSNDTSNMDMICPGVTGTVKINSYSENATECSCTYSFIIPSSQLSNGTELNVYQLFDMSNSTKYAELVLDEADKVKGSNVNLKIDWTLYISYVRGD